jgi:hypothetical protein
MSHDHVNSKTGRSFDLTTVCRRVRENRPCAYCYVQTAREKGFRAKNRIDYQPYDGWVLRLRPDTVDQMNAIGGIRMFAFADYEPAFRADVRRFLGDCYFRYLDVKAVTKAPSFVAHHHDHPALKVIHVSIDNLRKGGSPISFARARALRESYPKVLIRCVCLTPEDLKFFGSKEWVDVITLNHGQNGFHQFTPLERAYARERYGDRLCCAERVCRNCRIKCNVGRVDAEIQEAG